MGETLLAVFLRAIKKDTDRNEITVVKAPDAKALADIKNNQGKKYVLTANDDILLSDAGEEAMAGITEQKMYQFTMLTSGLVRVKFDMKQYTDGYRAYIYPKINGILVAGSQDTLSLTYVSKSFDIAVGEGDLLQFWGDNSGAAGQCWVNGVNICGISALGTPAIGIVSM